MLEGNKMVIGTLLAQRTLDIFKPNNTDHENDDRKAIGMLVDSNVFTALLIQQRIFIP